MKCAVRGSLQIQDANKSPSRHHRTTLSGHIFATKAFIDNGKNLLSSNTSSTCPHNMVNFGPLTAEIGSGVWGTPTNFSGFCVLAALLHGSRRQPNFAALNRGCHLSSAGRPSGWALAHTHSSLFFFFLLLLSSPNLRSRRLDVCHTSTHLVALVRI